MEARWHRGPPGSGAARRCHGVRDEGTGTILIEILGDGQEGTYVEPNRMSVYDFLVDIWLPARSSTLRPSTAASYEGILRNYIIPKQGAKRLQSLTGADLNRLYQNLLKSGRTESRRRGMGPGLSPKSIRRVPVRRDSRAEPAVHFAVT